MKRIVYIILVSLLFFGCAKTKEQKAIKKDKNKISLRLEGMVYPSKKFTLYSSVDGLVKKIYVSNGSKVYTDSNITLLENKDLNLEIKKLKKEILLLKKNISNNTAYINKALLKISKKELKRVANLKVVDAASDFELDNYKRNYLYDLKNYKESIDQAKEKNKTLKKELNEKQAELEKLLIKQKNLIVKSPINGFVTDLKISPTMKIFINQKICDIINLDEIKVKAGLPPGLLPFVKVGQKVRIDFITEPQYSAYGKISKINPVIDEKFQNMTIEITLKNNNYLLQPGVRALILIYLSKEDQKKVKELFDSKGGIIEIPSDI